MSAGASSDKRIDSVRDRVYLELPLPIEFKRPPSTGKITFVM
jgi:hypothetical protein